MSTRISKLTKPERAILERCFSEEINGALGDLSLPAQMRKSKALAKLLDSGLVEPATVTIPGRFPVEVSGYRLTRRGHVIYCAWAAA